MLVGSISTKKKTNSLLANRKYIDSNKQNQSYVNKSKKNTVHVFIQSGMPAIQTSEHKQGYLAIQYDTNISLRKHPNKNKRLSISKSVMQICYCDKGP